MIALSISALVSGCGAAGGELGDSPDGEVIKDTWMDDEGESLSEQSVDVVSEAAEDSSSASATQPVASQLGSLRQALSSNESCDTVGANRSVTGGFASAFTTSTSYGPSSCGNAYRVNVNNYDDRTGARFGNSIRHGDSEPSSESACEKMQVGTYELPRCQLRAAIQASPGQWQWLLPPDHSALQPHSSPPSPLVSASK